MSSKEPVPRGETPWLLDIQPQSCGKRSLVFQATQVLAFC